MQHLLTHLELGLVFVFFQHDSFLSEKFSGSLGLTFLQIENLNFIHLEWTLKK